MIAERASFDDALEHAATASEPGRDHAAPMRRRRDRGCSRPQFLLVVASGALLLPRARRCCSRCCRCTSSAGSAATTLASASRRCAVRGRRGAAAPVRRAPRRPLRPPSRSSSAARCIVAVSIALYGVVESRAVPRGRAHAQRARRGGVLRRRGHDDHRPRADRAAGRGDLATGRSRSTAGSRSGPRSGELVLDDDRYDTHVAGGGRARACRGRARALFTREVAAPGHAAGAGQPLMQPLRARAPASCCSSGSSASPGSPRSCRSTSRTSTSSGAGGIFLLYGVLDPRRPHLRRPPARPLGSRRAGTLALIGGAARHGDHGGVVVASPGCSSATVVFAAGMSLMYPAMLAARAQPASPDTERASVVGTVSSFFDLSQGLGALAARRCRRARRLPRPRSRSPVRSRSVGLVVLWTIARARPARAARSRPRSSPPEPGSRRCRPCSSPTTSRRSSAGSSRTSTSCGGGCRPTRRRCSRRRTPATDEWDAAQPFRVERTRERVLFPTPGLARRIDALATRGRGRRDLPRPALPLGLRRAAPARPRPTSS